MKKRNIFNAIIFYIIPVLIVLIIISLHSSRLINKQLQIILIILTILSIIYLIRNFIKNKQENTAAPRKKKIIFNSIYGIYILSCICFLFLLYGPVKTFREWLITTAMRTMNHQYFCEWFYSDEEINNVFENNYIIESEDSSDETIIDFEKNKSFANEYEKKLYQNLKEDEIYRIIKFKVNGCDAFLAAIYDPSRITMAISNNFPDTGQYVTKTAERNKAVLAINGGGFVDPEHNSLGGMPEGVSISNKKIYTGHNEKRNIIGITKDNKLVLLKNKTAKEALAMGVRDAVSHSPFLVTNGESSFIKGTGGWGYAARTAIGQRKDGTILFLVVDSNATRTKGASMNDLAKIMMNYGAINAANLDGGTSSVMVENYKIINTPIDSALKNKTRPVATAFIVR